MKEPTCPRLFEVEALRDGRLEGAERCDFERHLDSCRACSNEARALRQLAERLAAESRPGADDLHVRREKLRLLAAFNDELLRQPRPSQRRRLVALAAALTVFVATAWLWRGQVSPTPQEAREFATIHAQEGTRWTRRSEAKRDVVFLHSGRLNIHVTGTNLSPALLVVLPDGELEDIGTKFSVSVDGVRTRRVVVEEGAVLLRLRGRAPLAISAGGEWTAESEPAAQASSATALPLSTAAPAPAVARSAAATARTPEPSNLPHPPLRPSSEPASAASPSAIAPAHAAADAFGTAVSALNSGRNAEAAALFAQFMAVHGGDARAQDAAYLRVVALQATGDSGATRAAARDYLRAYPKGFRRTEVERLAR